MPEPTTHLGAVAASGAGAGTVAAVLGLDAGALFWAFLGAVCWQAIQPQVATRAEIIKSAGVAIVSTVLGTFGSVWTVALLLNFYPFLAAVDVRALIALPAFILGLLGYALLLLGLRLIRQYRSEGAA